MLLELVREFESRRGEILYFFAKIKKDQLLRAPSVGKHNSTRVNSRSPPWSSGNPRMLLELVREFESRRGDILYLFAKIKKDQLLRAPSVGKHNSTRVDEGRNK